MCVVFRLTLLLSSVAFPSSVLGSWPALQPDAANHIELVQTEISAAAMSASAVQSNGSRTLA